MMAMNHSNVGFGFIFIRLPLTLIITFLLVSCLLLGYLLFNLLIWFPSFGSKLGV